MRTSNGCWTCRLRHKKCDERQPTCNNCAALNITCHFDEDKPDWMDGGSRQEEMATWLKHEVKQRSHRRTTVGSGNTVGDSISRTETTTAEQIVLPQQIPESLTAGDILGNTFEPHVEAFSSGLRTGNTLNFVGKIAGECLSPRRSDTILMMFHLEHILPFLFPFYCPSALRGGRAWVLELMIKSPVVRQATLCQSAYFFSLARSFTDRAALWEDVLSQSQAAFEGLRQALQIINSAGVSEHMHGAARIMAGIMQMQRFDIAISSFSNSKAHLNAALALFQNLLDNSGINESDSPSAKFNACFSLLGPASLDLISSCPSIPSAEQAAFRFSSALLIFDDIIASTVLQTQPRLYECHPSLLSHFDDTDPIVSLEATLGCQNWALIEISEIAVLDAWKQQCKMIGNLDVMQLVYRATTIRNSILSHLSRLETGPVFVPEQRDSLLDVLAIDPIQPSNSPTSQITLVTRVWAHAALLYLSFVVSGSQPANSEVCYHVDQILELLAHQLSPPALLRTMVWPFCVAGCLAEPVQEAQLRGMVEALQPASVFGTLRKALEVMEYTWRNRNSEDAANWDLATCFRSQGELVLLV